MALGDTFPNESQSHRDPVTGALVRRVTSHASIHHHPFYYMPAYDDTMRRLYFVSHRTGLPQVYAELQEDGRLMQLTDCEDLNEWSVHPSHDGRHIYYTAGARALRAEIETGREEELAHFPIPIRKQGMVGDAMGTTSLSRDDHWWALPVKEGANARLVIIDTTTGDQQVILERDVIGHPQIHPDDAQWLRYAGPYTDRIWILRRDGSDHRLVYERDIAAKEWIVHETWVPGSREILTVNWRRGVMVIHADTGETRRVADFNAWHPMVSRDGSQIVTDTRNPDSGLILCDPRQRYSAQQVLCFPNASNRGDHWDCGHCPYDDGPVDVYAPQYTHPHPQFSPDGRRVVYTSDCMGHAQVYEVDLDSLAEFSR